MQSDKILSRPGHKIRTGLDKQNFVAVCQKLTLNPRLHREGPSSPLQLCNFDFIQFCAKRKAKPGRFGSLLVKDKKGLTMSQQAAIEKYEIPLV